MYPNFSSLVQERTEVVVPLTAEELKEAISRPVDRQGISLEPGLTESIINDVFEISFSIRKAKKRSDLKVVNWV